jgi:hypothetical protein
VRLEDRRLNGMAKVEAMRRGVMSRAWAVAKPIISKAERSVLRTLGIAKGRCPVCDGPAQVEALLKRRIQRCKSCQHAWVTSSPSPAKLARLYSGFDYWISDREHQSISDMRSGAHWADFVGARRKAMEDLGLTAHLGGLGRRGSVLEVGCSEGILVEDLASRGFDALGCDLNGEVIERARALGRPVIQCDFLAHDFGRKFDAIMSFHTFEHLPDVVAAMRRASSLLEPGGALLLELPFGPEEYDNVDHLHFFSLDSCRLLYGSGFSNVAIRQNDYRRADGVEAGSYVVCGFKVG